MSGSRYVLLYALVMGLVVSTLLTAVGQFAAPYREANARAAEVRNILEVLGVEVAERAGAQELVDLYEQAVSEERRGDLTLYRYDTVPGTGGASAAYAVRFAGQGLWGPIKGFLALEPDLRTIRGVSFYEQEETPGLGGEIVSAKFRRQFVGKSIVGPDGRPGLRIVKPGMAQAPNEVDAITGATMTSARVEAMLNEVIGKISASTKDSGEGPENE